jgi:hypothetical protein
MTRTVKEIYADISWVSDRLHDSQEHAQIVRLERRLQRLQAEYAAAKQREPKP